MRFSVLRSLLVTVVVFGLPQALHAQLPSLGQAQQLLQDPNAVAQLKQRIGASGLTPDQIRARLSAAGYPSDLLDSYLGNGSDSASGAPSNDIFAAVRQLGMADSTDVTFMRCGVNPDTISLGDTLALGSHAGLAQGASDSLSPLAGRLAAQRKTVLDRCLSNESLSASSGPGKFSSDSGFAIFGLDFFRRSSTVFEPNLNGPVDANYRLGPGDRLVLVLTGDVEASYSLDVTREGFIVIPQVGQVEVNNLTLGQLEDLLYDRLGRVYSGIRRGTDATTHFSVTPARLRSNLIYVTGNVVHPGAYQVSSAGTLLNALYAAGGPSESGSLRKIEVRRNGQLVGTLDFYDYLIKGDASNDVRLSNGDVVYVPVSLPRVRIVGQVVRPATYEIKPSETLADVLRYAEGFTASAARDRVQIERIVPPDQRVGGRDRIVKDVVSDAFENGFGPKEPISPGDIIHVLSVTERVRNRIYVDGNVNTPGPQGLTPGMQVSDALRRAGGVKSDTYLDRVLISRLLPDSTRVQLRVELRDTTGAVVHDFPLQEDDQIQVFSRTEFRPDRYVAINGAVQKGGQFPYKEGMTLRDLVLLAGGLDQSAYLNSAKIARLPLDRSGARTATEFEVPLDSSYLFERTPGGEYFGPPGLPAAKGPTPDVELRPYDNVLILRQPGWELQRTVVVAGEVRFPGRYTLLSKNEKITDVIKRAGGLTHEAYANGVSFYREGNNVGRIGIDLSTALQDPRYRDNLLLQDGDSIYIPRFSAIVSVQGSVNSPVAVSYVPGQDLNYYIRAAGGPSVKADVDRAYVTQPNGKVEAIAKRFLIPNSVPVPKPGSTVYVPERDPNYRPPDPVAITGAIAGILSSLVAIAIAIGR